MHVILAAIIVFLTLVARALVAAIAADVGRRISSTFWVIRAFDRTLGRLIPDHTWGGTWTVTWFVDSENFETINSTTSTVYRCFSMVALEGSGAVTAGGLRRYLFTGRLSSDRSILTGVWFDAQEASAGYHGAFQLRLRGAQNKAEGLWIGFSRMSRDIRSGPLQWTK